ncbi:hypothetical protein F2P56_001693 [Juglans regia]|uniref:RING-type domain-containing protein n=2 Tax=Juglans regia TaxID=51240 RepID=A0A833Y788_JUGRE|nr:uncharacterized protein LOC109006075 isoform X2 [Juglans regia]KAF5480998.1 hypothetical protein F2P56_001693 [Juglans regia]
MPLLCCCSIKTASSCLRFISLDYGAISPIAIPSFFILKFVRLAAHFSNIRAAKPGIKNVITAHVPQVQCAAATREQNNSIEETTQVEEDRVSMDSGDPGRRWTSLKERLGFKGMGCCGSRRRPTSSSFSTLETLQENPHTAPPLSSGMNLAMALAAERNSREEKDEGPATEVKTLMRLIEETDGVDWRKKRRRDNKGADTDWVCCVCMERSKGAAFIPCGHTFCRVCSREMWVNRGTCPLCNRSILEILDIF